MWQIFTFGNGDVIAAVITGLKVMMTTGAYESLFRLGLLGLVIFALLHVTFNRRFLGPMLIGAVDLCADVRNLVLSADMREFSHADTISPFHALPTVPFQEKGPVPWSSSVSKMPSPRVTESMRSFMVSVYPRVKKRIHPR